MAIAKSRFVESGAFIAKTGGVLGTITGVVSDFLIPLMPVGLYVAGISIAIFLILVVIRVIIPKQKHADFVEKSNNVWFAPLAMTFIVISASTYGLFLWSDSHKDDGGVLAEYVPGVSELQELTKVAEQMVVEQKKTNQKLDELNKTSAKNEANTATIAEEQKATNVILRNSNDLAEQTAKNTALISEATFFNLINLSDALAQGNLTVLKTFHQEGRPLTSVNLPMNEFADPMILSAIRTNKTNIDKVLGFLYDKKVIDLNKKYTINVNTSQELSPIWQKYLRNDEIEWAKEKNYSFKEYQKHMMEKYAYEVPDNLKSAYKVKKSYDLSSLKVKWNGGPGRAITTMLVEAILVENQKAIDFLSENASKDVIGHIEMNSGVKILLQPKRMAKESSIKL